MTTQRPIPILAACLLLLAATGGGPSAQDDDREVRYGDRISILGGDIHVPAGQDQRGVVFCLGCDVRVEGRVREAIVVLGKLEVDGGDVRGQVVGVLSDLELRNAAVGDRLVNVLGTVDMQASQVDGQTVNISLGNWLPGLTALLFWLRIVALFAGFVMLLLLAAVVPDRVRVIAEEAPVRYVPAFFVGILVWLGAIVLLSIISITLIGIPLAIAGYFVLKWLGTAGIFFAVGRRIGRAFGGEMSLLGGILITFALFAALRLFPTPLGFWGLLLSAVLWTLFFLLVEIPALGLVVLTRFGTSSGGTALAPPYAPPAYAPPPATSSGAPPGSSGGSGHAGTDPDV